MLGVFRRYHVPAYQVDADFRPATIRLGPAHAYLTLRLQGFERAIKFRAFVILPAVKTLGDDLVRVSQKFQLCLEVLGILADRKPSLG